MKIVNSRGRVLLEVTRAVAIDIAGKTWPGDIFYCYSGDGLGGYGPLAQLHRTIQAIKTDNPSARIVGVLPQVSQ